MEATLVLVKPEIVKSNGIGQIIGVYEANKLTIENIKMLVPTKDLLAKHYEEHLGRDFYIDLEAFMMSGPVVALRVAGDMAVSKVRELNGSTNPKKARIGTIRYLYGTTVQANAVHGSADEAAAARELALWFNEED